MNLRTSLLALGLSLAAASAFAATPAASSANTPKPAAAATQHADHAAKPDKRECLKRSKVGHCEQWAATSTTKPAEAAKH